MTVRLQRKLFIILNYVVIIAIEISFRMVKEKIRVPMLSRKNEQPSKGSSEQQVFKNEAIFSKMQNIKNSTEEGLESSSGSKFQIPISHTSKTKKVTSRSKDQFKIPSPLKLKKVISLSKAKLKSPIKILPEFALTNLAKITSQEIATDMVIGVSSKISERKKSIEKSLDSETTTTSSSEKNSPKQNERATNQDVITEDIEHSSLPQNTTDVPTRVSSRISERKKRAPNKLLEYEVTNTRTSEESNSKQKEGVAKKDIISNNIEEVPPQTTTDVPTRVLSTISEGKKRALDESCKPVTEISSASEEKSPKQKEKSVKRDIITENVESSAEYEEATRENEGNKNDSQVDKRRYKVTIEIGDKLKKVLEHDFNLVNNKEKLIILPARPTVINILESWVLDHTTTLIEKMFSKRHKYSEAQDIIDETIVNINLCREMADGIRVYFDHTLAGLLLYGVERDQCNNMMLETRVVSVPLVLEESTTINDKTNESNIIVEKELNEKPKSSSPKKNYEGKETETEIEEASIKTSTSRSLGTSCLVSVKEPKTFNPTQEIKQITKTVSSSTKKRSKSPQEEPMSSELLDETKQETENMSSIPASTNSKTSSPPGSTLRSVSSPINETLVNDLTEKAKIWRLVKDDKIKSSMPSNIYGAIHLVRLFVRLPVLLRRSDLTKAKLKTVLKYIRMFLSFMRSHEEWFGEQFYMLKTNFEKLNTNQ